MTVQRRRYFDWLAFIALILTPCAACYLKWAAAQALSIRHVTRAEPGMTRGDVIAAFGRLPDDTWPIPGEGPHDTWDVYDGIISVSYDSNGRVQYRDCSAMPPFKMLL